MKNKSVTIKAAWITGLFMLVTAIIIGLFGLFDNKSNNESEINQQIVTNDSSIVNITNNQNDVKGDYVKEDIKVIIQESILDKSPVIVDSPGAIIGDKKEIYNVKSENQTGGVTVGKIETLNILTDKESLGIREPFGLYKDNKKVGTVVNPEMNEDKMIFTFDEIQLDKPMPMGDFSFIYSTFEFNKYTIRVNNARTITTTLPPGATGVKGEILEIK